eukprot:6197809-Pleurochrysis_carterae.AAC.2
MTSSSLLTQSQDAFDNTDPGGRFALGGGTPALAQALGTCDSQNQRYSAILRRLVPFVAGRVATGWPH